MQDFFPYKHISTEVIGSTRSIILKLNHLLITPDCLTELEHFFSWLSHHIEVSSILITGKNNHFCEGFDLAELSQFSNEEVHRLNQRLQKLVFICFFLPQTVIFDLKEKASGAGLEFAIGGDIRLAQEGAEIKFDHLAKGITPGCGGMGFLEAIIPQSYIRNWLFWAEKISSEQLVSSGFIHSFYKTPETELGIQIMKKISNISSIARIQTKRGLLEPLLEKLEKSKIWENKISQATLSVNEWRQVLSTDKFLSAKKLSTLLKNEFN